MTFNSDNNQEKMNNQPENFPDFKPGGKDYQDWQAFKEDGRVREEREIKKPGEETGILEGTAESAMERKENKDISESSKEGIKRVLDNGIMKKWYECADLWVENHKNYPGFPEGLQEDENRARKLEFMEKNGGFDELEKDPSFAKLLGDLEQMLVADIGLDYFSDRKEMQFYILKMLNDRSVDLWREYKQAYQEGDAQAMSDIKAEQNELFEYRKELFSNITGLNIEEAYFSQKIIDEEAQDDLSAIPYGKDTPEYQDVLKKILHSKFMNCEADQKIIENCHDLAEEDLAQAFYFARKIKEDPSKISATSQRLEKMGFIPLEFFERVAKQYQGGKESRLARRGDLSLTARQSISKIREFYRPYNVDSEGMEVRFLGAMQKEKMLESGKPAENSPTESSPIERNKQRGGMSLLGLAGVALGILPYIIDFLDVMYQASMDIWNTGYPDTSRKTYIGKMEEVNRKFYDTWYKKGGGGEKSEKK